MSGKVIIENSTFSHITHILEFFIHIIDTGSTDWTSELVFRMPSHEDNGRRMTIHNGAIWVAQGVDNSTPAPINRITVQGDSRTIEAGYGLSFGDGVISDLLGPIRWMVSAGDFLFASVGGGAANRNARIISFNGFLYKICPFFWADLP